MLNLPVYARAGIYYFHTRVGGNQIKRSLATTNKTLAIIKASKYMEAIIDLPPTTRTSYFSKKSVTMENDGHENKQI